MSRTTVLGLVASAAILPALCGQATAQTVADGKPIRIVVPFGPGGLADITMRLVGQKFAERTGQQVVVENRPSAGGILAAAAVTSAPADGTTLFVLSSGIAISKSILKSMPFDPATAFTPISTVAFFDLLILTKGTSPITSMADVMSRAKVDPAKFNIGTINPGSTQHTTAEFLRSATGVRMSIVPFRTTPDVATALLREDVTIAIESYAAMRAQIDDRQIKPVASTSDKRSALLPNVPTLKEGGIDVEVVGWNALVAPAGTPTQTVTTLNGHIRAIVDSADFKKRMFEAGTEARSSTPEELGKRLANDIVVWARVVKQAGIEPR